MDRKILFFILIIIFPQLLVAGISFSATIRTFTVSPSTLIFQNPNQDPDQVQEVSSPNLTVTIEVRQLPSSQNWVLEIESDGDLTSGGDSIPIGNVRWTVTGTATPPATFQNGTFSKAIYITTGQGPGGANCNGGGNNNRACVTCNFTFYLKNFWSYATGSYSRVINLRLTAGTGTGRVQQSRTFTLSLTLSARAKLQFGLLAMNFPDADPDSVPSNPANVNPLSVTSSGRTGSSQTATLTCLAGGDLISGTNTILISNMTWTATGTGYVAGTMNRTTAQTAGSWTGPGQRAGTFSYFLTNSWSYTTGNYSTSITYTLTAP
jgi:hypothetical protein